jgi:folate-binding protein YgfZ
MPINISTSPTIFRWQPAAWVRVTGSDAAAFLQGQFTNDLRPPGAGATYGLWLNLKGKVVADSFVLRGAAADEWWLGSYFSPAAVILARLEPLVIADDVTMTDETAAWSAVSVVGDGAAAWLAAVRPPGAFVFSGRRGAGEGAECVFPRGGPAYSPWLDALAARPEATAEEMQRCRIAAGVPAVGVDLGESDLPNEAGLEADAISYTKGCYLGQEVMARLKAMGQVRRRLERVRGIGSLPAVVPPAPVYAGDKVVGELRSAVSDGRGGWLGLAMLTLLQVANAPRLALAASGTNPVERIQPA